MQHTFASSKRLFAERLVESLLKCTDKQCEMIASSIEPNAAKVNARFKCAYYIFSRNKININSI